jgi:hypothetical protein
MITIEHVYPVACATLTKPPGLGDYLRGSLALAHHARKRGHGLRLDFSGHPIGRFLRQQPVAASAAPFGEFFDARATLVYDWLDGLVAGEPARLCTNLLPHESRIDANLCEGIRRQLEFVPAIDDAADRLRQSFGDDCFAVLHLRVADEDFDSKQQVGRALFDYVAGQVAPVWGRRIAVVSNNASMKQALCGHFGLPLIDTTAVHLGDNAGALDGVRDTLVDFALLARASQVYSHSVYGWKSGFSHWCAVLHGIPYERIDLTPARRLPRLRRWVRETMYAWEPSP